MFKSRLMSFIQSLITFKVFTPNISNFNNPNSDKSFPDPSDSLKAVTGSFPALTTGI